MYSKIMKNISSYLICLHVLPESTGDQIEFMSDIPFPGGWEIIVWTLYPLFQGMYAIEFIKQHLCNNFFLSKCIAWINYNRSKNKSVWCPHDFILNHLTFKWQQHNLWVAIKIVTFIRK